MIGSSIQETAARTQALDGTPPAGLTLRLGFDEGSGTTVHDSGPGAGEGQLRSIFDGTAGTIAGTIAAILWRRLDADAPRAKYSWDYEEEAMAAAAMAERDGCLMAPPSWSIRTRAVMVRSPWHASDRGC